MKRRAHRPLDAWIHSYVKHESAIDLEIDARLREIAQTLQDQQKAQHAETLAVLRRLQAELAELRDLDRLPQKLRSADGSPDRGSAPFAEEPAGPASG